MSIDLQADSGDEMSLRGGTWTFVLNLAQAFDWQPRGTRLPAEYANLKWDGRYDSNDGQRVSAEDAIALGAALQRALEDPNMPVVASGIARDLAKRVMEEFERITGDQLPAEKVEHDFDCDTSLLDAVIRFCSQGSFTIS